MPQCQGPQKKEDKKSMENDRIPLWKVNNGHCHATDHQSSGIAFFGETIVHRGSNVLSVYEPMSNVER
jgi:hypothetical protein